ncbi:MAG: type II CAAX prenyl endopeptidase Rce1 family protein, partial [Archangium sp.]
VMGNAIRNHEKIDAVALMTTPGAIVLAAFASQLGLLVSVRLFPPLFKDVGPDGWFKRVAWNVERFHAGRVLVAWLGTLATGSLATYVLEPLRQASDILTRFGEAARNAPPVIFAMLLLVGAVAPGLCEELMFRGLLQTRLIQRWGPLAGIAVTALLFGVYHFDLRQGLAAMAMGWWLGWFAWRDGSTVNVAFGHLLNNATAFMLSRFSPAVEAHERSPVFVAIAVFLLLACVVGASFLTKKKEVAA